MWTGGIYKYNWLLLGGTEYDPASDDRKKSTWLKKIKKTTNKQKTFNINLLWAKNNKKKKIMQNYCETLFSHSASLEMGNMKGLYMLKLVTTMYVLS